MRNYKIYQSDNKIIKAWVNGVFIESQAIDQLKNIASMPFIHSHVAAMPDVHYGLGATVGSVIATKKAIIPAAVGVDIGCFTIDTEVQLIDGVTKTFKELIDMDKNGEDIFGYALDKNTNTVKMTKFEAPRKTRTASEMIKITLDNGKTIECTPDHIFYDRNGAEIKAKDLQINIALMPLYSNTDTTIKDKSSIQKYNGLDGYTVIYQPKINNWSYAHVLADEYNYRNGLARIPDESSWCRHHIDFIKINNKPDNILRVGRKEHWNIHSKSVAETNKLGITGWLATEHKHPGTFSRAGKIGGKRTQDKIRSNPELKEKHRQTVIKNIQKANANPSEKMLAWRINENRPVFANSNNNMKLAQKLGKIASVVEYIKDNNIDEINQNIWNKYRTNVYNGFTWRTVCKTLNEAGLVEINNVKFNLNHTVLLVEKIQYETPIDVYCLTSPEFETFSLGAGVFVHNCGMMAVRTNLKAADLPESLKSLRSELEAAIPVGFNEYQNSDHLNSSFLKSNINNIIKSSEALISKHSDIEKSAKNIHMKIAQQAGTLGGGNHFIEICLDENQDVWVMLHSGSRGIGNIIGRHFIELAKKDMEQHFISLKDKNLSYLVEGTKHFDDYVEAVHWAQEYAALNRDIMMERVLNVLQKNFKGFHVTKEAINCHHNYISLENHFGENVYVTRKGAVRARTSDYGIIPGSMGAKSFIVKGKGNKESFCSCSHGAGRMMSRSKAKEVFTVDDHKLATSGVECRKDAGVIDETPLAYKDIDAVMNAQNDLVSIEHTLKQILCIKG